MFEKDEAANSLPFAWNGYLFIWVLRNGNVVVVIKMGAYIHGCLFCVGAYYLHFMVYM